MGDAFDSANLRNFWRYDCLRRRAEKGRLPDDDLERPARCNLIDTDGRTGPGYRETTELVAEALHPYRKQRTSLSPRKGSRGSSQKSANPTTYLSIDVARSVATAIEQQSHKLAR